MRLIYLIFFLCFFLHAGDPLDTLAKRESTQEYYLKWAKIKQISEPILDTENAFILVTNRDFYPDSSILMSDFLPKNASLKYILCQTKEDIFYLTFFPNLSLALNFLGTEKNFLTFVHGDGRTFTKIIENSKKIVQLYPVNLISFDYPSKKIDKNPIANYNLSKRNIIHSLTHFHDFILDIQTWKEEKIKENLDQIPKFSLMAHSLGGYLIAEYLKKYNACFSKTPIFDNLILLLVAVKHRKHDIWIKNSFAKENYVLFNEKDIVLKAAELLYFTHFLGRGTGKNLDPKTHYVDITDPTSIYHTPYDKINLMKKRTQLFNLFTQLFDSQKPELKNCSSHLYIIEK